MALTPVEIRHIRLRKAFVGYQTRQTDELLADIVDSFEDVWRDRARRPRSCRLCRRAARRFASSGNRQTPCGGGCALSLRASKPLECLLVRAAKALRRPTDRPARAPARRRLEIDRFPQGTAAHAEIDGDKDHKHRRESDGFD